MAHAMSSTAPVTTTKHRVFCFGDSLTAGTSPPSYEDFPYAPHLQSKLGEVIINKNEKVMVRHLGYPGWTSAELLNDAKGPAGLRTIIQKNKESNPLSVVVLLAGTNDLGYQRPVQDIANSVVSLHNLCYEENVPHTVAIGIPPSAYQSSNKEASEYAKHVNAKIQNYCQSEPRATYFPFPFPWVANDQRWASDGLHFSPTGYKELGESLAPVIKGILEI